MATVLVQSRPGERAPRRAIQYSRYSRFVGFMRWLLPTTALVLVALVVLWPRIMGTGGSLIVPMFVDEGADRLDSMRMFQPRYAGQTSEARPFSVIADSATIDPAEPDHVLLDRLAADIETDQRGVQLLAPAGTYHRERERLDLEGGIELLTSDGYRFETERARVLLRAGHVIGTQPVAGTGPTGTLAADQFEIRDGGGVLRFEGRVKVTVQPRQMDGGASS